jgi:hypothetical protein
MSSCHDWWVRRSVAFPWDRFYRLAVFRLSHLVTVRFISGQKASARPCPTRDMASGDVRTPWDPLTTMRLYSETATRLPPSVSSSCAPGTPLGPPPSSPPSWMPGTPTGPPPCSGSIAVEASAERAAYLDTTEIQHGRSSNCSSSADCDQDSLPLSSPVFRSEEYRCLPPACSPGCPVEVFMDKADSSGPKDSGLCIKAVPACLLMHGSTQPAAQVVTLTVLGGCVSQNSLDSCWTRPACCPQEIGVFEEDGSGTATSPPPSVSPTWVPGTPLGPPPSSSPFWMSGTPTGPLPCNRSMAVEGLAEMAVFIDATDNQQSRSSNCSSSADCDEDSLPLSSPVFRSLDRCWSCPACCPEEIGAFDGGGLGICFLMSDATKHARQTTTGASTGHCVDEVSWNRCKEYSSELPTMVWPVSPPSKAVGSSRSRSRSRSPGF